MKIVVYARFDGGSKMVGSLDLPAVPRIGETLYILDMKQTKMPAFKVTDVLWFTVPADVRREATEMPNVDDDLFQVAVLVEGEEPTS